jgi:RNA polymerase sigma-70 factor (ECF subfamily)
VWKKIDSFDPDQNFKTWLFTIARRTVIDHWRKNHDRRFSDLDTASSGQDWSESIPDPEPWPDQIFAQAELKTKLDQALKQLPKYDETIIFLHLNQDLNFSEIALILDKPVNTIKSQYRRAIIKLKDLLITAPN